MKNGPKLILIGIILIAFFIGLTVFRVKVYSQLSAWNTFVSICILLAGIAALSYGIYAVIKLPEIRERLRNMPDYSENNTQGG